jgi:hypothetical protein
VTLEAPPPDFNATYTWEEATLPTFNTMAQPISMPSPVYVEPKCMIEAGELTNTEFYVLDQRVGYLSTGATGLDHLWLRPRRRRRAS